jgi:hypothetical protein
MSTNVPTMMIASFAFMMTPSASEIREKAEGPGFARGGHRGRPGPCSMRGVKEHPQMSMIRAAIEIAFV